MNLPIPSEFEALAREQVAAGRYSSEADVLADALKQYLADREALLALLDPQSSNRIGRKGARSMPRTPNAAAVSETSARAHAQDSRLAARPSRHRRDLGTRHCPNHTRAPPCSKDQAAVDQARSRP